MVQQFSDSGAYVRIARSGRPDTAGTGMRAYKGILGVPNIMMEPSAYGVYEQILKNTKLAKDSVGYLYVSTAGGKQPSLWLMRKGTDSVSFTNTIFPDWVEMARVDAKGRIVAVNAGRTTVKTIAQRVADVDLNAIAAGWKNYEKAHGLFSTSPIDTARATIGTATFEVVYSRPSKRGRKIFGGDVVPYGQVWRTGANAATQLTTSSDISLGGTLVPAGKYTLFTIPGATGATLIVSRKTSEWGTDYDQTSDLARLPLTMRKLTTPVEKFTIAIAPRGGGGALRLSWDDREYSIPFTVK